MAPEALTLTYVLDRGLARSPAAGGGRHQLEPEPVPAHPQDLQPAGVQRGRGHDAGGGGARGEAQVPQPGQGNDALRESVVLLLGRDGEKTHKTPSRPPLDPLETEVR
eukprot:6201331-Pyramimonas_sp.AAC.1